MPPFLRWTFRCRKTSEKYLNTCVTQGWQRHFKATLIQWARKERGLFFLRSGVAAADDYFAWLQWRPRSTQPQQSMSVPVLRRFHVIMSKNFADISKIFAIPIPLTERCWDEVSSSGSLIMHVRVFLRNYNSVEIYIYMCIFLRSWFAWVQSNKICRYHNSVKIYRLYKLTQSEWEGLMPYATSPRCFSPVTCFRTREQIAVKMLRSTKHL